MNVKNGSMFTDIDWNLDDPNVMKCTLADGKTIYFKVTARSETERTTPRESTASKRANSQKLFLTITTDLGKIQT